MDILPLSLVGATKESDVPTPEEYTYWEDRKNRTFYIDFEIEEDYALIELAKIIIQLNIAEKDIPTSELQPIRLLIHSFGGDLEQANFFADLCIASRIPIITVAMGVAMSAGFIIFLSGHKRYAFKHTQMMVHSGNASLSGTAEQIDSAQKNYKKQIEDMKSYVLERTSIDEKTFNKNRSKDWYLTEEELKKYNVVDEIISNISVIF